MPRILAFLLLLGLALPAAGSAWPLFQAPEFRVRMPEPPRLKRETRTTPVGEITARNWSVRTGPASFTVTRVEVPPLALTLQGPEGVLDLATRTVLEKRKGTRPESRPARPYGFPGRELTYRGPAEAPSGRSRMFLAGHRLFVLDAVVPEGSGEAAVFLDSFELVPR